jgi:hypothetical protein
MPNIGIPPDANSRYTMRFAQPPAPACKDEAARRTQATPDFKP